MKLFDGAYIRQVLGDKIGLGIKLLFVFSVIYLISTGIGYPRIKLPLLCLVLFIAVFFVKNINQPLVWYLFLTVLLFDLISAYFARANHHFLLIYITILVIIFLKKGQPEDFLANIKFLVFIVLLFSGLQKLFSPQFISGDFYYYMFNTGKFFKSFLGFNHDMSGVVLHNDLLISELGRTDPNNLKSITLQNIAPNIGIISRIFAWFTIILELVAAIGILWKPKHTLSHAIFIILILGIFLTRMENGFLCLLTIGGIWLSESLRIRIIYVALTILFLAFIISRIGFY